MLANSPSFEWILICSLNSFSKYASIWSLNIIFLFEFWDSISFIIVAKLTNILPSLNFKYKKFANSILSFKSKI